MKQQLKITSIVPATHDVYRITTERPSGISFNSGQAADITLDKPGWEDEMRPFTFTSLPDEDFLEFTIKTYPSHNGVTNQIRALKAGDALLLHGVFGDIGYKGEGVFIAGGAGVTPFISIFRSLHRSGKLGNNKLLFANKTKADIINKEEFSSMLGKNFINILSDEKAEGFEQGFISAELIQRYMLPGNGYFYVCGPPPMMDAIEKELAVLKVPVENVVREAF
jgi:ferredoxin-NADP reductase